LEILAKLNAKMNANQTEMNFKMDTNQSKATKQEEMLAEMSARMAINLKEMKADRKRAREYLKGRCKK
jgi:hypothetical protein